MVKHLIDILNIIIGKDKMTFSIEKLEITDKTLRALIEIYQKDVEDFPNSKLAKENLNALYIAQSRITDLLEDKRVHGKGDNTN